MSVMFVVAVFLLYFVVPFYFLWLYFSNNSWPGRVTPAGLPFISVATRRSALRRVEVALSWSGTPVFPLDFFVFILIDLESVGLR